MELGVSAIVPQGRNKGKRGEREEGGRGGGGGGWRLRGGLHGSLLGQGSAAFCGADHRRRGGQGSTAFRGADLRNASRRSCGCLAWVWWRRSPT